MRYPRVGPGDAKTLGKYLERHAEPDAAAWKGRVAECDFGHVLCIPAYGEGAGALAAIESLPAGVLGEILIVLVVNENGASPEWVRSENQTTLAAIRERYLPRGAAGVADLRTHPRGALALIDRTGDGAFPAEQGVGLARKIAADVALQLWSEGRIASPWIHCSDADAQWPADYFDRPLHAVDAESSAHRSAWVYDFRHDPEPDRELAQAALRYELFLRYYVLGLRSAGSPWAFHSIGSTLAVGMLPYARVRGFPKRRAAEDFHLLAKLAKLGPVGALRGEPIRLRGRESERVPFGTGAGIRRARAAARRGETLQVPDPRAFAALALWLRGLRALADGDFAADGLQDWLSAGVLEDECVEAPALLGALDDVGALRAVAEGGTRIQSRAQEHFDALRTLRFLHRLRDRALPDRGLEDALREAPFIPAETLAPAGDLAALRERIAHFEESPTPSAAPCDV